MGRYLEIADQALSEITEYQSLTESQPKIDSPTYCELSELSEISPLVESVDQWSKKLRESPDELRRAAGDDWEEVSADIVGFADALAVNQIRESGAIPSSYTSETFCRKCNSRVPFYEGIPEIGSCSWCRDGQTPPPIPAVNE